jgi:hypothetical protein
VSQNAEKIDSAAGGLGNKNTSRSYDYSSSSDIDIKKGEEFEFKELQNSELLHSFIAK